MDATNNSPLVFFLMAANFTGSITDSSHHISPDTRRYMQQGWINVEPMSQTVGQH